MSCTKNKFFKQLVEQNFLNYGKRNISMKLLSWDRVKQVKVNSMYALRYGYTRQLKKNPPVQVFEYVFFDKENTYKVSLSYRISEKKIWDKKLKSMLGSLKFA